MLRILAPALLAMAMLAGAASSVAAQSTPEVDGDMEYPEGLVKMYSRSYSADMMAMFDLSTPDAMPTGWFMLSATVLEFESEETAAAGTEEMLAQLDAEVGAEEGLSMEEVELDVDFDHSARFAEVEEDGMITQVVQAIAQDGVYVYAVIGITMGEGSDPVPATEHALAAIQSAEVSEDAETYNADGMSEGGLWAKMPAAEDIQAEVPELTMIADQVYFPVTEGTPAS